ncbi:hypothetical protein CYMTET_4073, partial [Cymbomonas tetramitiformis]
VSLVLITKHVSGGAERGKNDFRHRRSWSFEGVRAFDHEISGGNGENAKMTKVYNTSIEYGKWLSESDTPVTLPKMPMYSENEMIPQDEDYPDPFEAIEEPDSKEYKGGTGNAGPTLECWYHKAFLVVWPKKHSIAVICAAGGLQALIASCERDATPSSPSPPAGTISTLQQILAYCDRNPKELYPSCTSFAYTQVSNAPDASMLAALIRTVTAVCIEPAAATLASTVLVLMTRSCDSDDMMQAAHPDISKAMPGMVQAVGWAQMEIPMSNLVAHWCAGGPFIVEHTSALALSLRSQLGTAHAATQSVLKAVAAQVTSASGIVFSELPAHGACTLAKVLVLGGEEAPVNCGQTVEHSAMGMCREALHRFSQSSIIRGTMCQVVNLCIRLVLHRTANTPLGITSHHSVREIHFMLISVTGSGRAPWQSAEHQYLLPLLKEVVLFEDRLRRQQLQLGREYPGAMHVGQLVSAVLGCASSGALVKTILRQRWFSPWLGRMRVQSGENAKDSQCEPIVDQLRRLVQARVAALRAETAACCPFTWHQPKAQFSSSHPQVQAFLQGDQQSTTYHGVKDTTHARDFVCQHFGYPFGQCRNGYSANATACGSARGAYVQIVKTKAAWEQMATDRAKDKAEINRLESVLMSGFIPQVEKENESNHAVNMDLT